LAFGIPMNKDVVRRILAARCTPTPDAAGPSWLTTLGHAKDSLWSVDLFRCESAILRTHWVLVVMDQCTRRIVGLACSAAPWMARRLPGGRLASVRIDWSDAVSGHPRDTSPPLLRFFVGFIRQRLARQPVGTGSAQIRRSIAPNRRLVR
jgi:hypothetical protein